MISSLSLPCYCLLGDESLPKNSEAALSSSACGSCLARMVWLNREPRRIIAQRISNSSIYRYSNRSTTARCSDYTHAALSWLFTATQSSSAELGYRPDRLSLDSSQKEQQSISKIRCVKRFSPTLSHTKRRSRTSC